MDSHLYKTLTRKRSIWLDMDRLYGISSGDNVEEEERTRRYAESSQCYEKHVQLFKEKARQCRQSSVQIMFAPVSVGICPFLEEIILELVSHSTSLDDLSFWYHCAEVEPQTEFEDKVLDAVCSNTQISLKRLDISSLVHFEPGSPRTVLLQKLQDFQFFPSSPQSFSHGSCAAWEEAMAAGNCLKRLQLYSDFENTDDERVKAFCETMKRSLPHMADLEALKCDLSAYPNLRETVIDRMPSLKHVGISGRNVAFDLASMSLPKQSLHLGRGLCVEGTIPTSSTVTTKYIRLDAVLSKEAFLSLANLKHLDRLEVNAVQNNATVVQLLKASDSITDYDTWIETDLPFQARRFLQCNERFKMYKKKRRVLPRKATPHLLNALQQKPSLVYSVLQHEIEMLAQRNTSHDVVSST